jgi:hypothetical protein
VQISRQRSLSIVDGDGFDAGEQQPVFEARQGDAIAPSRGDAGDADVFAQKVARPARAEPSVAADAALQPLRVVQRSNGVPMCPLLQTDSIRYSAASRSLSLR